MEGFIRCYQLLVEGTKTRRQSCRADMLLIMLSKQPHHIPFTANSPSLAPYLFMYTGQGQLIGGSITTQSAPTYPTLHPFGCQGWIGPIISMMYDSPQCPLLCPQVLFSSYSSPKISTELLPTVLITQRSSWCYKGNQAAGTRVTGDRFVFLHNTNRLHFN